MAMRPGQTVLVFVAGCAIYASMAACSGAKNPTTTTGSTTSSGTAGGAPAGAGGAGGHGASGTGGVAAGGGGAGGAGGSQGGTRLKRMYLAATDGARDTSIVELPTGRPENEWWDSARQETCAFQTAADGKLRCLPTDTTNTSGYQQAGGQCQQMAGVLPSAPGCTQYVPKYLAVYGAPSQCPVAGQESPLHVFPVGALVGQLMCTQNATCTQQGCTDPGYVYYDVGAEVDPTKFVSATLDADP
jgi:hypothetical protein